VQEVLAIPGIRETDVIEHAGYMKSESSEAEARIVREDDALAHA